MSKPPGNASQGEWGIVSGARRRWRSYPRGEDAPSTTLGPSSPSYPKVLAEVYKTLFREVLCLFGKEGSEGTHSRSNICSPPDGPASPAQSICVNSVSKETARATELHLLTNGKKEKLIKSPRLGPWPHFQGNLPRQMRF